MEESSNTAVSEDKQPESNASEIGLPRKRGRKPMSDAEKKAAAKKRAAQKKELANLEERKAGLDAMEADLEAREKAVEEREAEAMALQANSDTLGGSERDTLIRETTTRANLELLKALGCEDVASLIPK